MPRVAGQVPGDREKVTSIARAFSDAHSPIEPWETYPGIRQSPVDSTPFKVGAGVLIFIGGAILHVVGFGALAVRDIAKE
jgi:hypothetical protein